MRVARAEARIEPDHPQQAFRLGIEVAAGEPVDPERLGDQAFDRKPRAQRGDRILEDQLHAPAHLAQRIALHRREIVTVGDGIVRRRVEVFGVGLSWRYPLELVSNWRPTGDDDGVKSFITFDYEGPKGSKAVRFGTGLTEPRAEEICAEVWSRFPSLRPRSRVDVSGS